MQSEASVQRAILLDLGGDPGIRLWKQPVGKFVPASTVQGALRLLERGDIPGALQMLRNARYTSVGIKGMSDLGGVMQGGRALQVEVKREDGRESVEQRAWRRVMNKMGALAIVARSVEEARHKVGPGGTPPEA